MAPENRPPLKDNFIPRRTYIVRQFLLDLQVKAHAKAQPFHPTLTLVFDAFSLMILGFDLGRGFQEGARNALTFAMSGKSRCREEYGIHSRHSDWPIAPLPDRIWMESECAGSRWAEGIAIELGVAIETSPLNSSTQRAITAESTRLFSDLSQTTLVESRKFIPLVLAKIEKENRRPHRYLRNVRSTVGTKSKTPFPAEVWEWSSRNTLTPRTCVSSDEICVALLVSRSAYLSARGLTLCGLTYVPGSGEGDMECPLHQSNEVPVKLDPSSIRRIYVKGKSGRFAPWILESPDMPHADISWKQWEALQEAERRKRVHSYRLRNVADLVEAKAETEVLLSPKSVQTAL